MYNLHDKWYICSVMKARKKNPDPPNKGKKKLNRTEQYIGDLDMASRKKVFDKFLQVRNPLTNEIQPYGEFRDSLLGSQRELIRKYLEDEGMELDVDKYIRQKFEESKKSFIGNNAEKNAIPEEFRGELYSRSLDETKKLDRTTNLVKNRVRETNEKYGKESRETRTYNRKIDKQSNQRIDNDIAMGKRDPETGDLYLTPSNKKIAKKRNTNKPAKEAEGLGLKPDPITSPTRNIANRVKPVNIKNKEAVEGEDIAPKSPVPGLFERLFDNVKTGIKKGLDKSRMGGLPKTNERKRKAGPGKFRRNSRAYRRLR